MAIEENLTGELIVPLRDEIRDKWLRDYNLRLNGTADIGKGGIPYARASTMADAAAAIYANSVVIAKNVASATKSGKALDGDLERAGTKRLPAVGATGFVQISASAGGTTIFFGDEIKRGSLRYQCTLTKVYQDGQDVPIQGIDTGPDTNLDPGVVLQWSAPRPGCGQKATVVAKSDGSGLSGGRNVESDDEAKLRLSQLRANPRASGNEAEFIQAIIDTPGIPVEQAFVYPGIKGPGTMGFVFTVRPALAGASRIPDAVQIAAVLAHIKGLFPGDDGIFAGTIVSQPTNTALRVTWATGVPGWVDAQPWPLYEGAFAIPPEISSVISATAFTVAGVDAPPQVGQTFAVFDRNNRTFRKKRILTVTPLSVSDYALVCDTTNNASDTTYTPLVAQPLCPWSDSLQALVDPVLNYFDSLGPGEQMALFFDPGVRQRRVPRDGEDWPSTITNRLLAPIKSRDETDPPGLFDLPHLRSVSLITPSDPTAVAVGTPGVSSNMFTLRYLLAFP
jgi:uncharacterized phage protein gp47/JayE